MSELNKHRQTKEYKLSDQGGEYIINKDGEPVEIDSKLEECHQKLWGESYYNDPSEHDGDTERDYIEEAKIEIADTVSKRFNDLIFKMVSEEMSKRGVFQSQNYFSYEGYELFEDQWFEFYHEHHGDILAQIQNKLIY